MDDLFPALTGSAQPADAVPPPVAAMTPPGRAIDDPAVVRDAIFNKALDTVRALPPVQSATHTLRFSSPAYEGPQTYSVAQQKQAVLGRHSLARRLRATAELVDNASGQTLAKRRLTIASIPYYTDRGTFINNGTEYPIANQLRLKPGIYTRQKDNGELEAHVNILPGQGVPHRIFFEPQTGIFRVKIGQANIPLVPMLQALGVTTPQLREMWGDALTDVNLHKTRAGDLTKLYERLVRNPTANDPPTQYAQIREALEKTKLDPEVSRRTLGTPFERIDLASTLATTRKLLAVHNRKDPEFLKRLKLEAADPDDRDHLAFMSLLGPEDIIAERIRGGANGLRAVLWKAARKGDLKAAVSGLLDKSVRGAILDSGLAQATECYDAETRVLTKRGFVFWANVNADDEFACLINGKLEYHRAERQYAYDYEGELLCCRTASMDYAVTPNHRIYAKSMSKSAFRIESAANAHGRQRWFMAWLPELAAQQQTPETVVITGATCRERRLPDLVFNTHDWCEFLGWWLAEGSACAGHRGREWRVSIAQSEGANPEKCAQIAALLTRMTLCWRYSAKGCEFVIRNKQLCQYLLALGVRREKRIPRAVFDFDVTAMRKLFDAYIAGDGNTSDTTKSSTVAPQLALDLMELYARLGYSPNRGANRPKDGDVLWFSAQKYRYALSDRDAVRLGKPRAYTKRHYSGKVYCATVPGGLLFVMRKRAPHWSGNSINPAQVFEQQIRVTRMGVGGIPSTDAIPASSRSVQPSHLGFIDPIITPESDRAGVDSRMTRLLRKGANGEMYAPFRNMQTGEMDWKQPQDLYDSVIGFPGTGDIPKPGQPVSMQQYLNLKRGLANGRIVEVPGRGGAESQYWVPAMVRGNVKLVPSSTVEYQLPHMESGFSPMANMVPIKSSMKGQRVAMAARMITQALPLEKAEAPYVQSGVPGEEGSFEELFGARMGAVRAEQGGRVLAVNPDGIQVQYADGTQKTIELAQNFPGARKTYTHQEPLVQAGQTFAPGTLLAKSNFVDKSGAMALGLNVRTGWLPLKGFNFEDAVVVSESLAKRLASQHLYQHKIDFDPKTDTTGLKKYVSIFPGKFNRSQLEALDDDGVVRVGQRVEFGDPLVLVAGKRTGRVGEVSRAGASSFSDQSETWGHHTAGIVTDVSKTNRGTVVAVKSIAPLVEGDKLCYSADTDVLTDTGWLPITQLTATHRIASLTAGGELEYVAPLCVNRYAHDGRMYALQTTQVDLLVTDNHKLYAKPRNPTNNGDYRLIEAQRLFGKRYKLKIDADVWRGCDPSTITLEGATATDRWGNTTALPALVLPLDTYVLLLGLFVTEGNILRQPESGSYGIDISQVKQPNRDILAAALTVRGITYCETGDKFRIYSKQLWHHFKDQRRSDTKCLPPTVFNWTRETLRKLYGWLMFGDGCETGTGHTYRTTSLQLADDLQRLCLHIGYAARITPAAPAPTELWIKGRRVISTRPAYVVSIYRHKTAPEINHGHVKRQNGQHETWAQYAGDVYCPTLPKNHVLYVRRNGKACWCGNSNRYGGKGVVAKVVPDDEMPVAADGKPLEFLQNPLGIISRSNPAQVAEALLGKVAALTGQPYRFKDFEDVDDVMAFAKQELRKYGIPDTEDLTDPLSGRSIPKVLVGNSYLMKLHHTSESKAAGRAFGSYTAEGAPAKGGPDGSKTWGMLHLNALLSHGATGAIRDASLVRGQRNHDYWMDVMSGRNPADPPVPEVYQKFVHQLQGAGINPVREGTRTHLMAMTQRNIDALAGDREVQSPDTVDWNDAKMAPIAGGLFDEEIFGGANGSRWGKITLSEPMPNPVMEEPIRRVLGLTKNQFEDVIAGRMPLGGATGPAALGAALGRINVDKEIELANLTIKHGRASHRDAAIRKLQYLMGAKRTGVMPSDWMWQSVPVLPPRFRPVSKMKGSDVPMVADANYLYRDLFENNRNLRDNAAAFEDVSEERLGLYNSLRAVTGLGDPAPAKLQEQKVKGLLQHVFGSSPKYSVVQRRLLGSTTDLVGRSTIIPNPDLDMDSVGIPENAAWKIYQPFIVRHLVKRGMSLSRAAAMVKGQHEVARDAMLSVMNERPVIIDRAPVLHRYGVMAFRPRLTKSNNLETSPVVIKGFGGDYDGDAMQFHVPASDDAVRDAYEKMLPSKNLFGVANFDINYGPSQEYLGGLYAGSTSRNNRRPVTFQTRAEAIRAYRQGAIDFDQPVEILE